MADYDVIVVGAGNAGMAAAMSAKEHGADRVLVQLHRILKPGGLLVSSTPCIRDFLPWFRYVGLVGRALGVLPRVNVFSEAELDGWLAAAGFVIEERWQPRPKSGIYIVARKPDPSKIDLQADAEIVKARAGSKGTKPLDRNQVRPKPSV